MASAFDWSPGGCCCEVPGWFDLYDHQLPAAARNGEFVRIPIMGESTATNANSRTQIGWSIVPSIGQMSHGNSASYNIWGGQVPGKEYIWHYERPGPNNQGAHQCALYDAGTQTEIVRVLGVQNFGQQRSTVNGLVGASPDYLGVFRGAGLSIYTIKYTGETFDAVTPQGLLVSDYNVNCVAPRNWPKLIASRLVAGTATWILADAFNEGAAMLINQQIILTRQSDATPTVLSFDYFGGHWGAVVSWSEAGTVRFALLVDGTVIGEQSSTNPWLGVHAAYPHETLGGGFVVIPTLTDESPIYPARMVVYQNGAELWQSAKIHSGLSISHSSDRWIYLQVNQRIIGPGQFAPGAIPSEVTNGLFTSYSSPTQYYLCRHDGTQIVPIGKDSTTPATMGNPLNTPNGFDAFTVMGDIDCETVRNSELVPNVVPADLAFLAS